MTVSLSTTLANERELRFFRIGAASCTWGHCSTVHHSRSARQLADALDTARHGAPTPSRGVASAPPPPPPSASAPLKSQSPFPSPPATGKGGYFRPFIRIFRGTASTKSTPHTSASCRRYSKTSLTSSPRCVRSSGVHVASPGLHCASGRHWNSSASSPTSPTSCRTHAAERRRSPQDAAGRRRRPQADSHARVRWGLGGTVRGGQGGADRTASSRLRGVWCGAHARASRKATRRACRSRRPRSAAGSLPAMEPSE